MVDLLCVVAPWMACTEVRIGMVAGLSTPVWVLRMPVDVRLSLGRSGPVLLRRTTGMLSYSSLEVPSNEYRVPSAPGYSVLGTHYSVLIMRVSLQGAC